MWEDVGMASVNFWLEQYGRNYMSYDSILVSLIFAYTVGTDF